jgi:hypothetical protein
MSYWFRLYTDVLDDPKAQWLSGDDFKGWINILCLAKENDGLLPSTKVIAFRLRMSEVEANHLVEALTSAGLLDHSNEGISPHNWDSRQFISDDDPTAALRARRYRQKPNVTDTVTRDVTDASHPPETEYRAETETEQSREEASAAKPRSARRPTQCDEEFLAELQANPAYAMFDVRRLYQKMVVWCQNAGEQPTRGRFINWLNKEDRPMTAKSKPPAQANVGAPLPVAPVPPAEVNGFMSEHIEDLIAANDLIHVGHEYDEIIKRGGAKVEWEIRCVTWYELHKNEPATPEQMAELNASINALAKR